MDAVASNIGDKIRAKFPNAFVLVVGLRCWRRAPLGAGAFLVVHCQWGPLPLVALRCPPCCPSLSYGVFVCRLTTQKSTRI